MVLEELTFEQRDGAEPELVTVTMTRAEAIWIASLAGNQRGAGVHNGIYSCLVGDVFNRYYEHGVSGPDDHVTVPTFDYGEEKADA